MRPVNSLLPLLHNPQTRRSHKQHDQPEQYPPCPPSSANRQQRRQHGQGAGALDQADIEPAAGEQARGDVERRDDLPVLQQDRASMRYRENQCTLVSFK